MSVHARGRVVLGGIHRARNGLGRAIARALPSSAPIGGGRRKVIAGLSMTSMIDVLVVMTVFLPAAVVKSVVMTAARSGYPSIDFMVHSAHEG
jgi:hypothetical protein